MEESNSRKRSLLETAFNNQCKFKNQKKIEVAKIFAMSYPTLYRKLHPNSDLQSDFIQKLSVFLDKSEDEILELHQSFENEVEEPLVEKNKTNTKLPLYTALLFIISAIFYFFRTSIAPAELIENDNRIKHQAEYSGSGVDIDLSSPIKLDNFHSSLYKYTFIDLKTVLSGEDITLTCDILITELANPENKFLGQLYASGVNINGKAALSYKITNGSNHETWVGVFMLQLSLSKGAAGYWLTIHNDYDPKSSGKFAMGDIHLKRNINEIPSE
jgi:hypothetical protein